MFLRGDSTPRGRGSRGHPSELPRAHVGELGAELPRVRRGETRSKFSQSRMRHAAASAVPSSCLPAVRACRPTTRRGPGAGSGPSCAEGAHARVQLRRTGLRRA